MMQQRQRRGLGCFGTLMLTVFVLVMLSTALAFLAPGAFMRWFSNLSTSGSAPLPVITSFTASPTIVRAGSDVTFNWNSTNGRSAQLEVIGLSLGVFSNLPANGSRAVRFEQAGTYQVRLTVSNAGVSTTQQIRVIVNPAR
jgi:PKD repeat protein